MIDVAIVLVFLFWPTGMFRQGRIEVEIDDGAFDQWPTVTVVAGRNETMRVNGHPCDPAELRHRFVRLIADSGARYQDVFHALDVARGAHARVVLELPSRRP